MTQKGVYILAIHGLRGFKCPLAFCIPLYLQLLWGQGCRQCGMFVVLRSSVLHRSINRRAFCARWLEKHLSSAYLRVILYNSYQGLLMDNPSCIVCRLLAVREEGIPQLHRTSKCTTSQPPAISKSPPIWSKLAFFQTTQSLLATLPAVNVTMRYKIRLQQWGHIPWAVKAEDIYALGAPNAIQI